MRLLNNRNKVHFLLESAAKIVLEVSFKKVNFWKKTDTLQGAAATHPKINPDYLAGLCSPWGAHVPLKSQFLLQVTKCTN